MRLLCFSPRVIRRFLLVCILFTGCGQNSGGADGSSGARSAVKPPVGIVSAQELAQFIDLGKVTAPEGAEFHVRLASHVEGSAPGKVPVAGEFYTKQFAALGWVPSKEPGGNISTDAYMQAMLMKSGCAVSLSVMPHDDSKVHFSLRSYGNLDSRKLPRSDQATLIYGSQTMTMYATPTKVAEEADFVQKALTAAGWQEYVAPHTAKVDDHERRSLSLRQKGYTLSVAISVAPAQQGKTVVQTMVGTITHELPAPANATDVEYDDERWNATCRIPENLGAAAAYYRSAMAAAGYETKRGEEPTKKRVHLLFHSKDKDVVMVNLVSDGEDASKATLRGLSAAAIAEIDKPRPAPAEPTEKPPEATLFAQDLPLPKDAKGVVYETKAEEIKFRSPREIEELVAELRAQLTAAGWQEDQNFALVDKNAGSLEWKQGTASISITLINTGLGDGTTATMSAKGFLWRKSRATK